MNKPLLFGIVAGVLILGAGVAMASQPATSVPAGTTNKAAQQALDALRSGQAGVIQNTGIALATTDAAISAGLVRTAQFIDESNRLPADIAALIVGSVRTTDPVQMAGTAAVLQTRSYGAKALELRTVSEFVKWLLSGAQNAAKPALTMLQTGAGVTGTGASAAGSIPTGLTGVTNQGTAAMATAAGIQISQADAQAVADVIATADAAKIRAKADEFRRAGKVDIATSLEAAAAAIEKAKQTAVSSGAGTTSTPANSQRVLAGKVALALKDSATSWKGTSREPKALVMQFQSQEALPRSDGSYGSETALALAERYSIVPPKPLYWGAKGGNYKTLVADKLAYQKRLAAIAVKDPQRSDEWALAAKV